MTYISGALSKDRRFVDVWERENGKVKRKRYDAPYYFYIEGDGKYKDIHGKSLIRLDFENASEFYNAKREYKDQNIKLFESDINPIYKVISKNYHNKDVGKLHFSFFDIETDYKIYSANPDDKVRIRKKL